MLRDKESRDRTWWRSWHKISHLQSKPSCDKPDDLPATLSSKGVPQRRQGLNHLRLLKLMTSTGQPFQKEGESWQQSTKKGKGEAGREKLLTAVRASCDCPLMKRQPTYLSRLFKGYPKSEPRRESTLRALLLSLVCLFFIFSVISFRVRHPLSIGTSCPLCFCYIFRLCAGRTHVPVLVCKI
jgi:hypothetical protein